jgi:hypothetical protein
MKAQKRRTTDPLAPLVPLARVVAVGLVAAVATLTAVQLGATGPTPTSISAHGTGTALTTTGTATATATSAPGTATGSANEQAAIKEANTLLGEVKLPPGSVRLTSRPDNAPDLEMAPFLPQVSTMVSRTGWWSSTLGPADALAWMRAHPAAGLFPDATGLSLIGFQGNGSGVIDQINVYAETFALPGGKTGIQVSSVVVFQPLRTAQETIPTVAKLVATPQYPRPENGDGAPATFTDQAEISRVAQIINALPTFYLGVYSCPADSGGGLSLDFESGSGTVLAQVELKSGGCGGVFVTAHGRLQPTLAGGSTTIQQIQAVLGTHWPVTPRLP